MRKNRRKVRFFAFPLEFFHPELLVIFWAMSFTKPVQLTFDNSLSVR